jgi:hypothetical protein
MINSIAVDFSPMPSLLRRRAECSTARAPPPGQDKIECAARHDATGLTRIRQTTGDRDEYGGNHGGIAQPATPFPIELEMV